METFELCKKLHKLKPDWLPEDRLFIRRKGEQPEVIKGVSFVTCFDEAPRYTLEYLLDKLPMTLKSSYGFGILILSGNGGHWSAFYMGDDECFVMDGGLNYDAQTPLCAVLKLAIAAAERDLV